MARRTGGRGFWAGFFTGLVIVALAGLALAWIYPPLQPPALDAGALEAPGAPDAPEGAAAAPEPLLTPAPGPVVDGLPDPAAPPGDGPAPGPGSPSLVPPDDG
jgi:hypothetical protein